MSNQVFKQATMSRVQAAMQIAAHVTNSDPTMKDGADKGRACVELARLILEEDDRQVSKRVILPGH
jgi:hypothetical protein